MFDWFEVKTVVLNAWFSHSYTEKIHSFSLPFDCWQTEPPVLSVVGISSTRQGSGHPSPHLRGWQWCLIQPAYPSKPPGQTVPPQDVPNTMTLGRGRYTSDLIPIKSPLGFLLKTMWRDSDTFLSQLFKGTALWWSCYFGDVANSS